MVRATSGWQDRPSRTLTYVAVFVGGMVGGAARYLISLAWPGEEGELPWAILVINLGGAFILSLLLAGWLRRGHVQHPWRPFLGTGLLGALTTWSTFMADTRDLFRADQTALGSAYVVLGTGAGIGAAAIGWWLASRLVPAAEGQA